MNLIYWDSCDHDKEEKRIIKENTLKIENGPNGVKLQPINNQESYYILKTNNRWFLPPNFTITFDITNIEDNIHMWIGNKKAAKDENSRIICATDKLNLKEGINHITINYDKGNTVFKNGDEVKYSINKDIGEAISFWFAFLGKNTSNKSITIKNIKVTTNIPTFSVFGACTSRDIFNSVLNPGYKNHFKVERSIARGSIIGLMEEPVEYNEEDVIVKEGTGGIPGSTKKRTGILKDNLNKDFIQILKEIKPEFLIMDFTFEVKAGYLEIDNNKIITNNAFELPYSNFYKNLKNVRKVKIKSHPKEFLKLWKKNCNKFFKEMEKNCPDTTIILNSAKDTSKMKKADGTIEEVPKFKEVSKLANSYRVILEDYVCKNFDVEVVDYDYTTTSDENHPWQASSVHYEPRYYKYATEQLKDIVKRTRLAKNNPDFVELNNEIKQLRREKIILKNKVFKEKQKNILKTETNLLKIEENKKLENKINTILSSNSWKITKPLRYLIDILKK